DPVEDGPPLGATDRGQVREHRLVDHEESGVLAAQLELVEVRFVPIACVDVGDLLVRAVHDDPVALALAVVDAALPPGEHRLALVLLDAEVERAREVRHALVPDEMPVAGRDLVALLTPTALGREEPLPSRDLPL